MLPALLLLGRLAAQAQHPHSSTPTDRPSTHGMLIFGTQHVYASHLPMFHSPHDYQVVLELDLSDSAQTAYRASQQQFPTETVYTLEPEQFVLPQMVQQPRPFRATLYRGHFERGGTAIARQLTVRIKQVLYFQHLSPTVHPQPALLLIGQYPEQFVVHRIAAQPDFDQVAAVVARGDAKAVSTTEPPVRVLPSAAAKTPCTAGQELRVQSDAGNSVRPLTVSHSLYLEYDDLR
ncbi:hypothetical protein [Hymenobacter metallicola]|uniref:Uncharacterized protein n=1 Tax=Hymenobacter metallicola TaxID=2563114 RepID=A0A4Z0QGB6_9BACT|nr:hypothetical protein [Hymenobacter metallicola]TGE29060.1 hypothetical protein E5K02_06285 [Hymenobacter metallicola]